MNIVDVIILLLLLSGLVVGFKNGVIKQSVKFIGTILVVVLSFILKSNLSSLFIENFPIFKFEGLPFLNVLLYEVLSFILLLILFSFVLKLIVFLTGILEKILKATIILGVISRILGAIVGFLQMYLIIYIVLLVLVNPIFNFKFLNNSKYKDMILSKTFIMSKYTAKTVETYDLIAAELKNIKVDNEQIYAIIRNSKIIKEETLNKFKKRSEEK